MQRTREYWQHWVRSLAVPLEYQREVIRAAISLKLCHFEETGAIIARAHDVHPRGAGNVTQLGLSLLCCCVTPFS